MDWETAAARAAEALVPGRWFLDCDTDADGVCGAAVMATALRRAGRGVQVRASRDKTQAAYEALADVECDGYIFIDKGSSHLEALAELGRRTERHIVVVDHHNVEAVPDGVVVCNPRLAGLDGSRDASAATTALAVALALDARNIDLAGTALAGATGDWQHEGGWQGWNLEAGQRAKEAGYLAQHVLPALVGISIASAMPRHHGPGLETEAESRVFIESLGLNPDIDVDSLTGQQSTQLVSAWTRHLVEHGASEEQLDRLVRREWRDVRVGMGVRHLFRVIDACGRLGQAGVGLAFLFGDRKAKAEAFELFDTYQGWLGDGLRVLREDGTTPLQALQWARTARPELTGMVAGIGMTVIVADRSRPMVIVADRPDGDMQVSTRGSNEMVERGLDLGRAILEAAGTVGREGGGHPVASGTVIAPADLDKLLVALDDVLQKQGFQDV